MPRKHFASNRRTGADIFPPKETEGIYADLRKGIARASRRRADCGEIDRIVETLDRAIAVIPAAMVS
jgi:hypothetical protein